jgi:hypothetical protein
MRKSNWRKKFKNIIGKDNSKAAPQDTPAISTSNDSAIDGGGADTTMTLPITVSTLDESACTPDSPAVRDTTVVEATQADLGDATHSPPLGQSHDQKLFRFFLAGTGFVVNLTMEVADACPILKGVAAGLNVIVDHASVRLALYLRNLVSNICIGKTTRSNRVIATDIWERVERLIEWMGAPLDDDEQERQKRLIECVTYYL